MPLKEFHRAHPQPVGTIYHDARHSKTVSGIAYQSALRRGLNSSQAKLISQVALLHDWDPRREAGAQARVPSTIAALRADFAGHKPMFARFRGTSVLRQRFGWGERELRIAEAMIQRTEFPFSDAHKNPFYKEQSPDSRYESMLKAMGPADRALVMREAAILSEYVDKSSLYYTRPFETVAQTVTGLANELRHDIGPKAPTHPQLLGGTGSFIETIGQAVNFAKDREIAQRLGVSLRIPNRAEFFATLPAQYAKRFASTLTGFRVLGRNLKRGKSLGRSTKKATRAARRAMLRRR
jgi:hypothetical protein